MPQTEKYNLQRVLELRERTRDEAAKNLSESKRLLNVAENELKNRKKAVENCRREQQETQNQMLEKSSGGIKMSEIIRYRQHLIDLRELEAKLIAAVDEQKNVVARAEKIVEKSLIALNEAAKELKVIEKHRANWEAGMKKQIDKREQKSNDEIAVILHERQKFE